MDYLKENFFISVNIKWLEQFLILTSVATILPFFIHSQLITGPIINAVLILALFLLGLKSALLISCLPSFIALGSGLLPLTLAPVIPFIILSNIIFVFVINQFNKRNKITERDYLIGASSAALLKFVFLLFSVNILASFFIRENLVSIVGQMLGLMQLISAFLGILIAYPFLKFLKIFE